MGWGLCVGGGLPFASAFCSWDVARAEVVGKGGGGLCWEVGGLGRGGEWGPGREGYGVEEGLVDVCEGCGIDREGCEVGGEGAWVSFWVGVVEEKVE